VRKEKDLFNSVLPTIVDAVVKTVDPASGLRERVLPAVTELVETLVTSYSTVAFHRPTQRLALSKAPGAIAVYDLKSGTTQHVLDGHQHLATELTFSPDGKSIAAVDTEDRVLLVWRFVSGILSYLGTATTGESDRLLQPRTKVGVEGTGEMKVQWTAERKVKVAVAGAVKEVAI
jgi:WD40 repeat protein